MKILVCVKRVVDHTMHIRVKADGSGVDTANMKTVMNPFDEIAVEEAVRWKEKGLASEVVVLSIGPKQSVDTIYAGLAMGADRGIHLNVDSLPDPPGAAAAIRAVVNEEQPQAVFLGKQAVDDDCCQTGQMLAALLGWGQGTFASAIIKEGEALKVTREIDGGREVVLLPLPAVVTVDLPLNEPRYASLPSIMKARKKPVRIIAPELSAERRLEVLKVAEPPRRKPGKRVGSAAELIACLENETEALS
ncbi:MAG: electron transfer flavoprotein subunit beta/FixA family protein [Methylobacteriaceae bacterium]|jgi:electron transfer flavoprotein beta subunit|nr:electron transfer flavoprotein subunit beta/FixA family protein [Methylobacteriaceae bacterium]